MRKTIFGIFVAMAGIILIGAACANKTADTVVPPQTDGEQDQAAGGQIDIKIAQNDLVGGYFTDSVGMALYIFTRDTGVESVCEGQCLVNWPIFYAENATLPAGLDRSDFGEITHPTGAEMSTYKGWPLYYYFGDSNPGDINGEGVDDVWYVAKSDYGVMFSTGSEGNYLVDDRGMALYYFTQDSKDTSVCEGQCLVNWPIFYAEDGAVPTTITDKADFGEIIRDNGIAQTTFKGWPLYYYAGDLVRGDMKGQGLNNAWFVIDPAALVPAATTTATSTR